MLISILIISYVVLLALVLVFNYGANAFSRREADKESKNS